MKGSLKIWTVILCMVVVGMGITLLMDSYVSCQIEKLAVETKEEVHGEEALLMNAVPAQEVGGSIPDGEKRAQTELFEAEEEMAEEDAGENRKTKRKAASEVLNPPSVAEENGEAEGNVSAAAALEASPAETISGETITDAVPETETFAEPSPKAGVFADAVPQMASENASSAGPAASQAKSSSVLVEVVEYPADLQEALREYAERFPQIDAQIEQMRTSEKENHNMYSVKNAAQTEQRIWDREMEGIYHLLCDFLDETSCQVLKKEQQEWLSVRDARAEEAAKKNSGGSLESVDYIASIASSNRERAYALLEKYQE